MDSDSQGLAASADSPGISSPGFAVSPGRRSTSPSAAVPVMASVPHVSYHVGALQDYTAAQEGTDILAFSGLASDPEGLDDGAANAGISDLSSTSPQTAGSRLRETDSEELVDATRVGGVRCAGTADSEELAVNARRDSDFLSAKALRRTHHELWDKSDSDEGVDYVPHACNGDSSHLPVLQDEAAQSEGRHNRYDHHKQDPASPSMEKGQPGHVENIFQGAHPMCGPHRVPRAFIAMHTLEYEALKTTPVVVLEGTGRNGRERVGGAESSRVREGGGEADPRDATSKPGHSGEDHVPAGELRA